MDSSQQHKPLNPVPYDDEEEGTGQSLELRRHDHDLLKREQEEQNLLASDRNIQTRRPNIFQRFARFVQGREADQEHELDEFMHEHTSLQRRRPRGMNGDRKHAAFEMESMDGYSDHSSEQDRETLEWAMHKTKV